MTGPRSLTRRTALGLLAGLGLPAGLGLAGCGRTAIGEVLLSAGRDGAADDLAARRLAAATAGRWPRLNLRVIDSTGSEENLDRAAADQVGLALAPLDAAAVRPDGSVVALGRLYESYLQVVVRADSKIDTVDQLAGRAVATGAARTATALTGSRVLAAAGLAGQVRARPLPDDVALAALLTGDLVAMIISAEAPTPALLAEAGRVRLLDLSGLFAALTRSDPETYDLVAVPADVYGTPSVVRTVGIPNLLVCPPSLSDDVTGAVTEVLINDATRLINPDALGAQFLDRRSVVVTGSIPLHPAAALTYRQAYG